MKIQAAKRNCDIKSEAVLVIFGINTMALFGTTLAWSQTSPINLAPGAAQGLKPLDANVWQNDIGSGFKAGAQSIGLDVGAAPGLKECGSTQAHGLALASLSYGRMLGQVKGESHWYRGNWEIHAELFGGAQYSPSSEWLVGLTPHLRYNFSTGTRLIPFVDGGAGFTGTSIRRPDLSGTFQFNEQGNVGVFWFMRDDVARTVEAGYMHLSNAGIDHPNNGVNCVKGMAGVSWFF